MFGEWPVVKRLEGDMRGGPGIAWLQQVLVFARERIPAPGRAFLRRKQLIAYVEDMLNCSPETIGSNFEEAIARMKRKAVASR